MFALGALGLALALSVGTYVVARQSLVEQRERAALRQTLSDAALVRSRLQTSGEEVSDVLGDLSAPSGTSVLLRRSGQWYSSSLDLRAEDVTRVVLPVVESGSVGSGWTDATDTPAIVVGVPLPDVGAEYFEVAVAEELQGTLSTLRIALAVCAAATTALGIALGRWASARALTPLEDVAQVAARISAGDLDARLGETEDPDLATLVGAFNNMVETVVERIQRDARFAADVSHELRTPLTTLITSVSALRSGTELSGRSADAVALIETELDRFRKALENLLVLGRLEAEVPYAETSAIGVSRLVQQSLLTLGRPAALTSVLAPEDDPVVCVDRQQMVRAFANLFENADRHGGGLTGVRVQRSGRFAEVHVEDRGPGVDPADREHIFERFARAGARRSAPGTGLGLSIVAQAARNHRGAAWCTNRPGGGADFVVRLPLAEGANR